MYVYAYCLDVHVHVRVLQVYIRGELADRYFSSTVACMWNSTALL